MEGTLMESVVRLALFLWFSICVPWITAGWFELASRLLLVFILHEADGDIDTFRWAGGALFTPLLHPTRVDMTSTIPSVPPVRGVVLSEEIGIDLRRMTGEVSR